jgi:hypothetical protein
MKIYRYTPFLLALFCASLANWKQNRPIPNRDTSTYYFTIPKDGQGNRSISSIETLPPIARQQLPRFVLYAQTFHHNDTDSSPVLLQPLIRNPAVTHVNIAAFHINGPGWIHLNDFPPSNTIYNTLWKEVEELKNSGIKVMAMLGGASRGSYWKLPSNNSTMVCTASRQVAKIKLLSDVVRKSLSTLEANFQKIRISRR